MKKFITVFVLVSLFIFPAFSEDTIFLTKDINVKYENSVFDELSNDSISVITSPSEYDDSGYVALYNSDMFEDFEFIYLSEDGQNILTNMINKYLNWETLAISKGVTISKDIPDFKIPVFAYYTSLGESHHVNGLTLTASFYSVSTKVHYLILETNKKPTKDNSYIKYSMDPLYFDHDAAITLKNSITKNNITNKIDEYKKQKALEDEFL